MFRIFASKKEEQPQQQQQIIQIPPRPLAIVPRTSAVSLGTYENLSNELGFYPAQLLEEKLKRFLVEQKIPTYNLAEVDRYLTHIARKNNAFWIWRPLRKQDKPQGWGWRGTRDTAKGDDPYKGYGHGSYMQQDWEYRPYDKAVPIHILRRVKKIQENFGNEVLFFVSDYAVSQPDPFIMVTALDVSRIVFGVWDEPRFDEEAAEE
jgi:hypothetical protein